MTTTTPPDRDALAALLAARSGEGRTVRIAGGGTSPARGRPVPADEIVSTAGLDRVVAYEPADLTLTVEGGATVADVNTLIAADGLVWPQADDRDGATVGGILSTASSGLTRLRWGPVRDSLLEVVIATGDGRLVRAGGRTVKGVAGYDLPRLVVGSLGTLGVIVEATLKLWPAPSAEGWFAVDGDDDALRAQAREILATRYRPGAVILERNRLWLYLAGAAADVAAPEGWQPHAEGPSPWPEIAGMQLGVDPARMADLTRGLQDARLPYRAQFGVGVCRIATPSMDDVAVARGLAEAHGGHGEAVGGDDAHRADPWGSPPPGVAIMRRLHDAFDPAHVLNPGAFIGDPAPTPV